MYWMDYSVPETMLSSVCLINAPIQPLQSCPGQGKLMHRIYSVTIVEMIPIKTSSSRSKALFALPD